VPTLLIHDFVGVSGIRATTGGLPLQENETTGVETPVSKLKSSEEDYIAFPERLLTLSFHVPHRIRKREQ